MKYEIVERQDNEKGHGDPIAESEYIGALRKPILSAIRSLIDPNGEVLITVSNSTGIKEFFVRQTKYAPDSK